MRGDGGDGALDYGAGFELDGDGFVGAFHEESRVPPVSQALSVAAFELGGSARDMDEQCAPCDLPDELHACDVVRFRAGLL